MSFFKKNKEKQDSDHDPVIVASIVNPVSSVIFQDILKENNIPFICRQDGAGGTIKILFGGGVVPDNIYVAQLNYEKARGLYEAYLITETDPDSDDNQEI